MSYAVAFLQKLTRGRLGTPIDAERYENPMLYVGTSNGDYAPTAFKALSPFPLMGTPEPVYGQPAYNSDPDVFIDEGRVYILNRTYFRKPATNGGAAKKEVLLSLIKGNIDGKENISKN